MKVTLYWDTPDPYIDQETVVVDCSEIAEIEPYSEWDDYLQREVSYLKVWFKDGRGGIFSFAKLGDVTLPKVIGGC